MKGDYAKIKIAKQQQNRNFAQTAYNLYQNIILTMLGAAHKHTCEKIHQN